MKTDFVLNSRRGFTKLDLVIVIAITVVIAGVVLPRMASRGGKPARIACIYNLKQIGIGFRLYAADGAPYPEYNSNNEVWQYFQVAGKEIGSPTALVCPEDAKLNKRKAALDFKNPAIITSLGHPTHQNKALSYFHSPDASEKKPGTILAGDRNISTNKATMSGVLTVRTNTPLQWTKEPHQEAGNILLGDGSAQQVSTGQLRDQFQVINQHYTNINQRLLIP